MMKCAACFLSFLLVLSSSAFANDEWDAMLEELGANEDQVMAADVNPTPTRVPVRTQANMPTQTRSPMEKPVVGELVDLSLSQAIGRIDALERRVAILERERRVYDERIRMLDRAVDDLKRRR